MIDERITTIGAGVAGASWLSLINNASLQLFNVPLVVVGMAAAGTLLSFGWSPSGTSRMKMYAMAAMITFLSTVSVAVVPAFMGWDWVTPAREAPLAGLLGISGRFVIPALIKLAPEIMRKIFKLDKESKDEAQA